MSDTPLIRDGKIILRLVDHDDGTITLKKPLPVKEQHIMQQTGTPGWDKRYVDQLFDGKNGNLEYIHGAAKYSIPIEVFRKHAYIGRHPVYGEQYHCERQWYEIQDVLIVEPVEGGGTITGGAYVTPPSRIEFGRSLLCPRCHGSGVEPGMRREGSCPRCLGHGIVPREPITR